jgi:glycosyltransferase involved in cell wall biosynthesis
MCTYNGSRFLREQLESIAAQTKQPVELVVCDDRSEDQTVKIVKGFAQQARFRVRLEINTTNLGSTKNFEKAIGLCQGSIIVLADQDDVWLPEKLERMVEVFERRTAIGGVFSDAELIDADSKPVSKTLWASARFNSREQDKFEEGQGLKVLLKHPTVTGATMGFRCKFRELIIPIPKNQIHDHWIAVLIASVSHLAPIGTTLIQYRKHENQQIGPWSVDSLWQQIQVSRSMTRDYLGEAERFNEICQRLSDRFATFSPHPSALRLIGQKIGHQKTRGDLPRPKLLRLGYLVRELITLRYWRYSNGWGSAARDLLV